MEEACFRAGLITALYVAMSVSFCLPHPVAVSDFMICRGLCACTEMLWMCVLYLSFGSKVRPRTFGCVAMGSALLFILGPDSGLAKFDWKVCLHSNQTWPIFYFASSHSRETEGI